MILEIAEFDILPGSEEDFERGVAEATPLFRSAVGCQSLKLYRSFEHSRRYRLAVEWLAIEDHTVTFRESPSFRRWRELVGRFFAAPPRVEHVHLVLAPF